MLDKYRAIWKALANENRLRILQSLSEEDSTFSNLMYSLRMNPRSLTSHLKWLRRHGFVSKEEKLYKLTEAGTALYKLEFLNFEKLKEVIPDGNAGSRP